MIEGDSDLEAPQVHDGALLVRQRAYAIAKVGTEVQALETAAINFCTGFAAVNRSKGIAMLAHFDPLSAPGFDRMVADLKVQAGGDLSGFEVHIVQGTPASSVWLAALLLALIPFAICDDWKALGASFAGVSAFLFFTRSWIRWRMGAVWPEAIKQSRITQHRPLPRLLQSMRLTCGFRVNVEGEVLVYPGYRDRLSKEHFVGRGSALNKAPGSI